MKRHLPFALVLGLVLVGSVFTGVALAADYNGKGYFPTNNLTYCQAGSYLLPNRAAIAKWSSTTDINLTQNCTTTHVRSQTWNWENNGYYGYAYICMTNGACDTFPLDSTYKSCKAESNTYYLDSWNDTQRQFNMTHELGHCWSLGHRDADATSVMQRGKLSIIEPNARDKELVNNRY